MTTKGVEDRRRKIMSWRAFALVTRSEARVHSGEWVVEVAWGLATVGGLQWLDAPSRGLITLPCPPERPVPGTKRRGYSGYR